jgi:hypothetical protein
MDKSSILKAYNTLFFEFFDDIMNIYPDNKEIKFSRDKFDLIKRANPTIIIKYWKANVYDTYKKQIEAGDVTFFLEKDYRSDLQSDEQTNRKVLEIIESIRATIRDMDDINRSHCSNYILNLSKLSLIYYDLTK